MADLAGLAQYLQTSPGWQQSMDMLKGQNAAAKDQEMRLQQAQIGEVQRQQQGREVLSAIMAKGAENLDANDIATIYGIDPDLGVRLAEMKRKEAAEARRQELIGGLMGGAGAASPEAAVAAGAMTGDPTLIQLGQFMAQRGDKEIDRTREDAGKETERVKYLKGLETDYRKEFTGLPEVKEFNSALSAYNSMVNAAGRGTGVGDTQLITLYYKTIDPTSTVRESEFENLANAGAFGDRVSTWVQGWTKGSKLSPAQRQEIIALAGQNIKARAGQIEPVAKQYRGIAEREGIDYRNIAPDITLPETIERPNAGGVPDGLTPEEWGAMTPEERAEWQ